MGRNHPCRPWLHQRGAAMSIPELRILPPFAIGRLGSADRPLDNYTVEDDPENPLGFRRIVGAPTFEIDEKGRIPERAHAEGGRLQGRRAHPPGGAFPRGLRRHRQEHAPAADA